MSSMHETPKAPPSPDVLDLLGVGCGPANLSLAALLEEEQAKIRRLFLDARPEPAWHPGMLIEGSQLQITVLKDLVTVRNPQSRFSFLKYLQEKGRLFEFLNLRNLFPTRLEFNDYLGWAAGELRSQLRFGKKVLSIEPGKRSSGGGVESLLAQVEDAATGEVETYPARNLVAAAGPTPWVPDGVRLDSQGFVFHANDFVPTLAERYPDPSKPYRFVVIGRGQSGAEIFEYLLKKYPNADITATMRGFGYKPVDESDFTNSVFFPEMIDFVYNLKETLRDEVVDSFRDVNYAVVDAPLIRRIYKALYDEKVQGRDRARLSPYLVLEGAAEEDGQAVARFRHRLSGEAVDLRGDAVIVCTGYRWSSRLPLLEPLVPYLETTSQGEFQMNRDYSIASRPGFSPKVYLQGYSERTHGLSETVLSLIPIRALDIWKSLQLHLAGTEGELYETAPAHSATP